MLEALGNCPGSLRSIPVPSFHSRHDNQQNFLKSSGFIVGWETKTNGCTVDGKTEGERVANLNPLLNSIGKDNIPSDYWLIDSGASCCVINKKSLENFEIHRYDSDS